MNIEDMKMKTQQIKTWDIAKEVLRGSLQW